MCSKNLLTSLAIFLIHTKYNTSFWFNTGVKSINCCFLTPIADILDHFGVYTGNQFHEWLGDKIQNKVNNKDITFKEVNQCHISFIFGCSWNEENNFNNLINFFLWILKGFHQKSKLIYRRFRLLENYIFQNTNG